MSIVISSVLSTLCLALGDAPGAEKAANLAMSLAPEADPDVHVLPGQYSCGCIKGAPHEMEPIHENWQTTERFRDLEVRADRVRCAHPLRALALYAALRANDG